MLNSVECKWIKITVVTISVCISLGKRPRGVDERIFALFIQNYINNMQRKSFQLKKLNWNIII